MRKCLRFLVAAFIFAFICNVCLIFMLWRDPVSVNTNTYPQVDRTVSEGNSKQGNLSRIDLIRLRSLNVGYSNKNFVSSKKYEDIVLSIQNELIVKEDGRDVQQLLSQWTKPEELLPNFSPELGRVINALQTSPVEVAEVSKKGTQLKVLVTLGGGFKALFKPQWYERSMIIEGSVYSGKDRHNAEIVAFYLSLLLGLRRTPIAVGRKFHLRREIWSKAEPKLSATFYKDDKNNTCFYGVCYYCKKEDPVCAAGNSIEGALILWLPASAKLKKWRSPWQRTYKDDVSAAWETDDSYCRKLQQQSSLYKPSSGNRRLLDLVETSVFDFLMSNGDRHHYEVIDGSPDSTILLIDNGKSFGRPDIDYLDILAPLYQCCVIRESFVERLRLFQHGGLSDALQQLTQADLLHPLLTGEHLKALDRRLAIVLEAVTFCSEETHSERMFY